MARKILRSEAPQNDRERGRAAPQNDSSFVILSAAKNLSSCLRGMVRKILRSEAPQNDRERGRAAPQNDSSFVILSPTPIVILSEAKNLFSRLKDMVRKILRRFRSSE